MLISKGICDQLTDLEMIEKSLNDIDYFSCLYDRYEAQLLRYIKRISVVTNEEAEDILQESYVKVWKNLNEFNPNLRLSSWLFRIVHNHTISYWRRNKRSKESPTITLSDKMLQVISDDIRVDGDDENIEERIQKAVQGLPEKYKEVLVLKYFENMSYEDISDVLRIPEGTVATRLNRARKALEKTTK